MATGGKTDRRVVRTRKAIMAAFDKLVVQYGIEKVTVSAIAREADIDRKTFYLHYNSVVDLVNKRTQAALEHVIGVLQERGEGKPPMERVRIVLAEVNKLLLANLDVYQNIASSLSVDDEVTAFFDIMSKTLADMGMKVKKADETLFRMRTQFYIAGALSLYSTWLQSDHSLPIQRVSDTIENAIKDTVFPTVCIARA